MRQASWRRADAHGAEPDRIELDAGRRSLHLRSLLESSVTKLDLASSAISRSARCRGAQAARDTAGDSRHQRHEAEHARPDLRCDRRCSAASGARASPVVEQRTRPIATERVDDSRPSVVSLVVLASEPSALMRCPELRSRLPSTSETVRRLSMRTANGARSDLRRPARFERALVTVGNGRSVGAMRATPAWRSGCLISVTSRRTASLAASSSADAPVGSSNEDMASTRPRSGSPTARDRGRESCGWRVGANFTGQGLARLVGD